MHSFDPDLSYTTTKPDALPEVTIDDIMGLVDQTRPQSMLDSFKELMTREFGFNFDRYDLIVSDDFAKEIGLVLPKRFRFDHGVSISRFLKGRTMCRLEKQTPFFQL